MYSRTYFFLKLLSFFESQDTIQNTKEQIVSNYDAQDNLSNVNKSGQFQDDARVFICFLKGLQKHSKWDKNN